MTSAASSRGQPHHQRSHPLRPPRLGVALEAEVLGHPGERARGDRVDGDAVAGQLVADDLREGGDAGLGGAVVRLAGVAVDARHRRGVDDPGVVRGTRLGPVAPVHGGVVRGRERALQVDADHRVPLVLGHREDHPVAQDPGVVDEHVEAAEQVDRLAAPARRRRRTTTRRRRWPPPRRPAAVISSTTAWAGPASPPLPSRAPPKSFTSTWAPCAASSSACSRPMPRPAPVTMHTRP